MNIIPTTTTATSDIHQNTFTRNHTTTFTTIKSKRSSGRNLLSLLGGAGVVLYLFLLLLLLLPYPMAVNSFRLPVVVLSRTSPPSVLQKGVIRYSRVHHPNSFLDTKTINSCSSCYSRSSNTSRIGISKSTIKNTSPQQHKQQQLFATSSSRADLSPPQEEDNEIKMYHLDCIGSTQDEARRILQDDTLHGTFVRSFVFVYCMIRGRCGMYWVLAHMIHSCANRSS